MHESPQVPNFVNRDLQKRGDFRLEPGLVLAVEPFLSTGADVAVEARDGWTLRTPDGSLSAQFEHTIVVTHGRPLVLTATTA